MRVDFVHTLNSKHRKKEPNFTAAKLGTTSLMIILKIRLIIKCDSCSTTRPSSSKVLVTLLLSKLLSVHFHQKKCFIQRFQCIKATYQ